MNNIRVVEGDKLYLENDKLCFSVPVFQERILVVKLEYLRKSESVIRSNIVTSVVCIEVSWTIKQNQNAP